VLSRPNQSRELRSCYPMCWGWGGLTEPSMLRTSKWASNLDGNVVCFLLGNIPASGVYVPYVVKSLGDGTRHAIGKQECLSCRQRKLSGNNIRDLQNMRRNLAGAQHIGWVTMSKRKIMCLHYLCI
jgi:hypothetical protein